MEIRIRCKIERRFALVRAWGGVVVARKMASPPPARWRASGSIDHSSRIMDDGDVDVHAPDATRFASVTSPEFAQPRIQRFQSLPEFHSTHGGHAAALAPCRVGKINGLFWHAGKRSVIWIVESLNVAFLNPPSHRICCKPRLSFFSTQRVRQCWKMSALEQSLQSSQRPIQDARKFTLDDRLSEQRGWISRLMIEADDDPSTPEAI